MQRVQRRRQARSPRTTRPSATRPRRRRRRAARRASCRRGWRSRTATAASAADDALIVIAAGARPFVPPDSRHRAGRVLTRQRLAAAPNCGQAGRARRRPIGCELARHPSPPGLSQVTQVEMLPRILARRPGPSATVTAGCADGVTCSPGHKAIARRVKAAAWSRCWSRRAAARRAIAFDALLVAGGPVANLAGYGLQELGVDHGPHGRGQRLPADELPEHLRRGRRGGPTSSPTPPPTRRGTRGQRARSIRSRSSAPTTAIPTPPSSSPRSRASAPNEPGRKKIAHEVTDL